MKFRWPKQVNKVIVCYHHMGDVILFTRVMVMQLQKTWTYGAAFFSVIQEDTNLLKETVFLTHAQRK